MNRTSFPVVVLLLSTAVLGGCATVARGPSFSEVKPAPPGPGFALVYVFREHAQPGAFGAKLLFDDEEGVTLNEKGFTWKYLAAGEHTIRTEWPLLSGQHNRSVTFPVLSGETYYLELLGVSYVSGVVAGAAQVRWESGLKVTDPRLGEERIARCCRFQAAQHTDSIPP